MSKAGGAFGWTTHLHWSFNFDRYGLVGELDFVQRLHPCVDIRMRRRCDDEGDEYRSEYVYYYH